MIFAPCDRQAQGHITTSSLIHLPRTLNLKAKPWESTSQTSGLPVNELIAKKCTRKIHIYWGMPNANAFYTDIAKQWIEEYDNIKYVPVVSDDTKNWQGRSGLVHKAILDDFTDLSDWVVYACGSPGMIESAKSDLLKQGLKTNNFYADAFTAAK